MTIECTDCGNTGEVSDPTPGKPVGYECGKCGARGVIVSKEDEGKFYTLSEQK